MYYRRKPLYRKILIALNILFLFFYLLVCLVPFVNTGVNWIVAVPGIIFPILFFLLLAFVVVWIIQKSKWLWVNVIAILLGIQQIFAVFSFHGNQKFTDEKKPGALRVMQWNVMGFDQGEEAFNIRSGGHSLRPYMFDLIKDQDADVLCMEEFYEPSDTARLGSNITLVSQIGFPYHLFRATRDNDSTGAGVAIFSKYPIVDTASFYLDSRKRDLLLSADIDLNGKKYRVFAVHLIPIGFGQWDEQRSIREEVYGDGGSSSVGRIFNRLIKTYPFRYHESLFVGQQVAQSEFPVIICGDFNDIPNSSTYFNVKQNLQDAFLKKGFWTGRTTRKSFGIISPTLRIDYILCSKSFTVDQFQVVHVGYSDHYPVVADLLY